MSALREFKVRLSGGANALTNIMSVVAETPTIALVRGATLALELGAADFEVFPAFRRRRAADAFCPLPRS